MNEPEETQDAELTLHNARKNIDEIDQDIIDLMFKFKIEAKKAYPIRGKPNFTKDEPSKAVQKITSLISRSIKTDHLHPQDKEHFEKKLEFCLTERFKEVANVTIAKKALGQNSDNLNDTRHEEVIENAVSLAESKGMDGKETRTVFSIISRNFAQIQYEFLEQNRGPIQDYINDQEQNAALNYAN